MFPVKLEGCNWEPFGQLLLTAWLRFLLEGCSAGEAGYQGYSVS